MQGISVFLIEHLQYVAPPLIGAFIGYFTNKVAIRMLFRPLNAWRILGVRIPMTPGVIPSRRNQLAKNIGEMVGEHLLTSKEIGNGLKKEKFQNHLYAVIQDRIGTVFNTDLGTLPEVIPLNYKHYFGIGVKTIIYSIKNLFNDYLGTPQFERQFHTSVETSFNQLIQRDVDFLVNRQEREKCYSFLDRNLSNMLSSKAMDLWIEDYVYGRVQTILKNRKSLSDLLPDSLIDLLFVSIEARIPDLLSKFADILKDPLIQDKIIAGIKTGVDNFIISLGPMGGMARNFIKTETIERVVKDYFVEKEEDISKWLQDEDVRKKVTTSILDRMRHYLHLPLVDIFALKDHDVEGLCKTLSNQIISIMREENTARILSSVLRENIEMYIQGGNDTIENILSDLFGEEGVEKSKKWIISEGVYLLRSQKTKDSIGMMIEKIISSLLQKRIGKISNIIPLGVREGIYRSLQKMAINMLAVEVPGLVSTLNIQAIVKEKVDSLDLLRLERLLLSIMEEQFKYINLFGALLGFIIGCINIVVISLH